MAVNPIADVTRGPPGAMYDEARMRSRLVDSVLLVSVVVAVAMSVACHEDMPARRSPLPTTVASDDVVMELGTHVGRVARRSPLGAPRIEGVQPARSRGRRLALLAPPPAAIDYEVVVPTGGILRVGTAITDEGNVARGGNDGVRFRVRVDGKVVWERALEGGRGGSSSRHWTDVEIDLQEFGEREVVVRLETDAAAGTSPGGVPAWSRVQLVRRTWASRQLSSPDAPNVVLVVVDTLRADRVGSYGADPTRTPNLDRLASKGLVFLHAWAQAPWTLPSVATILTGRYPRSHGVVGRSADFGRPAGLTDDGSNWAYLSDTIPTIASSVRRAGITTFGVTSNLLISRENNLARGFETFVELPVSPLPVQWARAAAVRSAFTEWLAGTGEYRFFAYLHYMEPHDPYVPGPGLRDRCPDTAAVEVCDGIVRNLARDRERTGVPLDEATVGYLEGLYDAEVESWDADLPELLAALERGGLHERTVVIVTADHGEEFGEHGHLGHRKQLFTESVAVPLVIAGAGIPKGVRTDIVELVDVMPTILGLAGLGAAAGELPGYDLMRGDSGRTQTFAETRYGVIDGREGAWELLGVREKRWGYQWAPAVSYQRLYDLRADAAERLDHSSKEPAACSEAQGAIRRWISRTPPPATAASTAAPITDKLRALGYVE